VKKKKENEKEKKKTKKKKKKQEKADVCRDYGLVNSTVQTICENRTNTVSAFEQNRSRIKRFRKPKRFDVDDGLTF
jgi:hypothetical protein